MKHLAILLILPAVVAGGLLAQGPARNASKTPQLDTLQGILRVHPKFHYRYYIEGFGDGQTCALFKADERLKPIEPGTVIRVRGDLASRFFGNANDPNAALVSTWIIFMDVKDVEIVGPRTGSPRLKR